MFIKEKGKYGEGSVEEYKRKRANGRKGSA